MANKFNWVSITTIKLFRNYKHVAESSLHTYLTQGGTGGFAASLRRLAIICEELASQIEAQEAQQTQQGYAKGEDDA